MQAAKPRNPLATIVKTNRAAFAAKRKIQSTQIDYLTLYTFFFLAKTIDSNVFLLDT